MYDDYVLISYGFVCANDFVRPIFHGYSNVLDVDKSLFSAFFSL